MQMKIIPKRCNFICNGVRTDIAGTYVGISIENCQKCGMYIYDVKTKKLQKDIPFTKDYAYGSFYCILLEGFDLSPYMYRFYKDETTFVDKFAEVIIGNDEYGCAVSSSELYGSVKSADALSATRELKIPFDRNIIYLCHLRGFSMKDSQKRKSAGTFLGITERISYFKDLGINAIEFMPVNEFIECPKADSNDMSYQLSSYRASDTSAIKVNYWGFSQYTYHFALKSSYAYGKDAAGEFAQMVDALHENGIECILQMYYSDNCDSRYIIESLLHMVTNFSVDGFRLLGNNIPINEIVANPALAGTKILADADFGAILQDKNVVYKNLCRVNENFMLSARKLLKSDDDMVSRVSYMLRENAKNYANVHYITDYYGFTLYDLVSYNRKHNDPNGEDNADGSTYNYSWNCGEEGDSTRKNVMALRKRQARNAMLLMMTGQATPVIRFGDEWLDTQFGNNNAYCQDNEIGWLVKKKLKLNKDFYEFTKNLIAFRQRHSILHQPKELMLSDYLSCKFPDISFHGEEAYRMNQDCDSREFAILYAGHYARQYTKEIEDSIYIIYNLHWEDKDFVLPISTNEGGWKLLYSTDGSTDESFDENNAKPWNSATYNAKGRSISILLYGPNL